MLGRALMLDGVGKSLIRQIICAGKTRSLSGKFGRIDSEEMSRRLFFVVSGEMRMLRVAPDGQEHLLQRYRAGEFFCLAAVVSGLTYNSQMINAGATELIYWNHDVFRRFMDDNVDLYRNILGQMAFQVEQEREMRIISRCCKVDVKVAAFLLYKIKQKQGSRRCGCSIDIRPISLTAQELGIARETLSRSLRRLANREGFTYQGGTVQVPNLSCLEAVLEEAECNCSC